jgi:glycosyltransferase involved in cell wall biosynthesis
MISKFRGYQGGVETHIHDLVSGLESIGHEVRLFSSEDLEGGHQFSAEASAVSAKIKSVASLFWNFDARKRLAEVVDKFQPDLLHYHSIYHQLSPSVLGISSIPAVMTLHDYKLVAPCYSLYRDSNICTECVGLAFPYPGVKHRCIKDSALASAVCATEQIVYQPRYRKNIDRFIVPSAYLKEKLLQSGFDEQHLQVVPWGVPAVGPRGPFAGIVGDQYFLYAGRLHESKGLNELLAAWVGLKDKGAAKLVVAGGGALREKVQNLANRDESVIYKGVLERPVLLELIAGARATVVPSIVPETMGLTALESLLAGTPVIASTRGALADLTGSGVISVTADRLEVELGTVLRRSIDDSYYLAEQREELATRDLSEYSREAMVARIAAVYGQVVETSISKTPASTDEVMP